MSLPFNRKHIKSDQSPAHVSQKCCSFVKFPNTHHTIIYIYSIFRLVSITSPHPLTSTWLCIWTICASLYPFAFVWCCSLWENRLATLLYIYLLRWNSVGLIKMRAHHDAHEMIFFHIYIYTIFICCRCFLVFCIENKNAHITYQSPRIQMRAHAMGIGIVFEYICICFVCYKRSIQGTQRIRATHPSHHFPYSSTSRPKQHIYKFKHMTRYATRRWRARRPKTYIYIW